MGVHTTLAWTAVVFLGGSIVCAFSEWLADEGKDRARRRGLETVVEELNRKTPFEVSQFVIIRLAERMRFFLRRPLLTYGVVVAFGMALNAAMPGVLLYSVVMSHMPSSPLELFFAPREVLQLLEDGLLVFVRDHWLSLAGGVAIVVVLGGLFDAISLAVTHRLICLAAATQRTFVLVRFLFVDVLIAGLSWVWAYATIAFALRTYYPEIVNTVGRYAGDFVEDYVTCTLWGTLQVNSGVWYVVVALGLSAAFPTILYLITMLLLLAFRMCPPWPQKFLVRLVSALTKDTRPVLTQLSIGMAAIATFLGAVVAAIQLSPR